MKTKEIIEVALKAGEILIVSGAEVYRVEDTLIRIFKSYRVDAECFVLLTGIFITARGKDGEVISILKRIKGHAFDLHKIELVNSFSRNLQNNPMGYEEALIALKDIENAPRYSFFVRLTSAGVTAFVYTLLFRGGMGEASVALLISLLIYAVKDKISQIGFFQFFEFFVSGVIAGGFSLAAVRIFPEMSVYKIIIGAIMFLVPGVAITNGIKDALYGDTVSSIYRIAEAVFISIAVAAGVGISLSIGLRWI